MVKALVKVPVPALSEVTASEIEGGDEVLQQTPLAVTDSPLSWVTSPPLDAVVKVIAERLAVVTVGISVLVVKLFSSP